MAEGERITTLHPEGKSGVNIEKWKYDRVKDATLSVLREAGTNGVRFRNVKVSDEPDLIDLVAPRLGTDWEGSAGWYVTSVKLDLEARGELERVPKVSPQRVRVPLG